MTEENWMAFIHAEISDDSQQESQTNAFVKSFVKTQRNGINAVISQNDREYSFNMISGNMKKKTLTLRCKHVKAGCSAKAKGIID